MTRERFGLSNVRYARVAFKRTFPRCLWLPSEKPAPQSIPGQLENLSGGRSQPEKASEPGLQPVQAVLMPLADLGAWFSPRLRPPSWFAPAHAIELARRRPSTIGEREFGAQRGERAGEGTAHPGQDPRA